MNPRKFNINIPSSSYNQITSKKMLEIAKDLNVDKQKVYRCVKKHNIPYKEENGIMYFDEVAQTRIKDIIKQTKSISKNSSEVFQKKDEAVKEAQFEAVVKRLDIIIELLQKGLEVKPEQTDDEDKKTNINFNGGI